MWIRDKLKKCLFPTIAISLVMTGSVYADSGGDSTVKVKIEGQLLQSEQAPVIVNETTLVPLRALFEALGAKVDWDASTRTVTATKGTSTVQLTIGKPTAFKNQEEIKLDVPGTIINGITMVPTRFVAESLGSIVTFDSATKTVNIDMPKPAVVSSPLVENQVKETSILGDPVSSPEQLYAFASKYNPLIPKELSQWYVLLGNVYHIRGDLAFIQMCKETNFFRFGGDVKLDQNNFAGIGATGNGAMGNQFASIKDGVEAHLQHLYAYATTDPLPPSEPLLDPRFQLVKRGIAPTWEQLGGRWATSKQYGQEIVSLYQRMNSTINI